MAGLNPVSRAIYATGIGISSFHLGDLREACDLFLEARRLFDLVEPKDRPLLNGVDPTILVLIYVGRTRTLQGFLEQGDRSIAEALDIAERGGSSHSRAYALQQATHQFFLKGDIAEATHRARKAFALAESIGFKSTHASSTLSLGRALVAAGQLDEGIGKLRDGYSRWCAASGKLQASEQAALAAEVL
jgi:tetratricopeptide (TPR) repeat protein